MMIKTTLRWFLADLHPPKAGAEVLVQTFNGEIHFAFMEHGQWYNIPPEDYHIHPPKWWGVPVGPE